MGKKSMTDSDKFLEGCLWMIAVFIFIAFMIGILFSMIYFVKFALDRNWISCIHILGLWVIGGGVINIEKGEK